MCASLCGVGAITSPSSEREREKDSDDEAADVLGVGDVEAGAADNEVADGVGEGEAEHVMGGVNHGGGERGRE